MLNVFDLEMLGTQQETAVTGYTREKDLSFKPFWNLKNWTVGQKNRFIIEENDIISKQKQEVTFSAKPVCSGSAHIRCGDLKGTEDISLHPVSTSSALFIY